MSWAAVSTHRALRAGSDTCRATQPANGESLTTSFPAIRSDRGRCDHPGPEARPRTSTGRAAATGRSPRRTTPAGRAAPAAAARWPRARSPPPCATGPGQGRCRSARRGTAARRRPCQRLGPPRDADRRGTWSRARPARPAMPVPRSGVYGAPIAETRCHAGLHAGPAAPARCPGSRRRTAWRSPSTARSCPGRPAARSGWRCARPGLCAGPDVRRGADVPGRPVRRGVRVRCRPRRGVPLRSWQVLAPASSPLRPPEREPSRCAAVPLR